MKKLYTLLLLGLSLLPGKGAFADTGSEFREPELKTLGTYSRLIFPLNSNGNFKIQGKAEGSDTVHLSLERVRVESWPELAKLQDARILGISANSVDLDKADIQIRFKDSATEYFAYLQPSPPAVIVDVWPKAGAPQAKVATTTKAKPTPVKKQIQAKTKAPARSLASAKAPKAPSVRDLVSKEPLPEALSLDKDFFQHFVLPIPGFQAKGQKFSSPPEADLENRWEFGKTIGKQHDDASLTFKFAIKLFEEKKFGLCLKSLEILERDFPKNPYAAEVTFLKALAYKRLGEVHEKPAFVVKAETMLRELMTRLDDKGHNLPFSATIRLYFTAKSFKDKQWLEAVEQFEFVVKLLGENDPDYPIISLSLAEAYHAVGQNRRAERIYRYVSEQRRGKPWGKEALYRIGDVLAYEHNYSRAIEEIESAIKQYPEYLSVRTEALFNLGEAYFWLGNYKRSEHALREFLKQNPSQTIGALAYVRLGEIAELTKQKSSVARENYLAAINSFPFSEGATLANLRLGRLDLGDKSDLNYHVHTLQEIFAKQDLSRDELLMAKLLLIQTERFQGQADQARAEALKQMTENTDRPYEIFRDQYVQAQGEHLANLLDSKQYSKILVEYENNKKWLEMYGAPVYGILAEAYKGLGLYDSSNQFMAQFATGLARQKGGGRQVASLVKPAELENYYNQGNYREVIRSLENGPQGALETEMAMISYFRLGEYKNAYRFADELRKDSVAMEKERTLGNVTEVLTHRALDDRNYSEMESILSEARRKLKEPDERLEYLYGDSLWYQRKHKPAVEAYTQALAKFPQSSRAERSQYYLAMSELELGHRREGVKRLAGLRDNSQSVWGSSAKQELELLEWESKYSTILRGLPPSGLGITR